MRVVPFDMPDLAEVIHSEVGDALRIASVYTETEFDSLYLRDDVESQYTASELESLRREIIVLALGKEKLEEVTHVGRLQRIIYETDDAVTIQVPLDGHTGVFVSLESSKRMQLFEVIEAVQTWIEQHELRTDGTASQ